MSEPEILPALHDNHTATDTSAQEKRASAPPESLVELVGQYPGVAIAAGLGLGLLAGALLPRSAARKLTARAGVLAAVAGEAGLTLGKQAIEKAGEAGRETRERFGHLGESVGELREVLGDTVASKAASAKHNAEHATTLARDTAIAILHKLTEIATKPRR